MGKHRTCQRWLDVLPTASLALVVGVAAQAQELGPLEQRGLRTSGWTFLPSLSLTLGYDDNVLAVPDSEPFSPEGDFITIVSPALRIERSAGRGTIFFDGAAEVGRYEDFDGQNYDDWRVGTGGTYDLDRTLTVFGSLRFRNDHEGADDPDRRVEEAEDTTEIERFRGDLGFRKDGRRTFVRVVGSVDRAEYDDLVAGVFPTFADIVADEPAGQVNVNLGRDRSSFGGALRVGYTPDPNYDLFVNFGYRAVRFDDNRVNLVRFGQTDQPAIGIDPATGAPVAGPANDLCGAGLLALDDCLAVQGANERDSERDFDNFSVRVGTAVDLDRLVTGEFGVGVQYTTFEDDRDGELGFSFDAGLDWIVSARNVVTFTGRQTVEPTDSEGAGANVTNLGLAWQHSLSPQIRLGADVGYRRDSRIGADRTDDEYRAGVFAAYDVNRFVSLAASYDYRQRDSTEEVREFTRNSVFLTLVGRY